MILLENWNLRNKLKTRLWNHRIKIMELLLLKLHRQK